MNSSSLRLGGGFLLSGLVIASLVLPVRTELSVRPPSLPADGRAVALAQLRSTNIWGLPIEGYLHPKGPVFAEGAEALGAKLIPGEQGSLTLRAGTAAGQLALSARGLKAKLQIFSTPDDLDGDGLPDAAERRSERARAAVTAWFTAIAEAQYTQLDDAWARIHQDCAGLVRFSLREALKRHDTAWLNHRRYLPRGALPDPGPPYYPALPFIGGLLFRAQSGRFDSSAPIDGQFTAAASARSLWQHNSRFISRDVKEAKAGDLLFFSVPYGHGSRMHTMIVLGAHAGATHNEPGRRLVYHTGAEGKAGQVRLLQISQLFGHPDPSWHPSPDNPRFLGVHRLSMLTRDHASQLATLTRGR